MKEKLERLAKSLGEHAEQLNKMGSGLAVIYKNIAEDIEQILKEDEKEIERLKKMAKKLKESVI